MVLMDLASDLAYYELLGDAGAINQQVALYGAVTPEMAQQFARETFVRNNSNTLLYKAKK